MQARVTCPTCQTTLGVRAAHGEGTILRCPKCRHEFAVRLRPPSPPPPANDPLSIPPPATAPRTSYNKALAPRSGRAVRPPATLRPAKAESNSSLLWIGIAGGTAFAIAAIVLVMIVMHIASPANNRGDDAQMADGTAPAAPTAIVGEATATVPPSVPAPDVAGNSQPAPPAPSVAVAPATPATQSPSAVPATGQPVSSVLPSSPFAVSPAPSPVVPPAPLLTYRFNSGEEYAYSFTLKADIAGQADQSSGMCTLSLSREAAPAEFAAQQQTGQGSGSGFVVTPDGYIVTCAHVVEGSTKLEVMLGMQTYPAQVVAFDKEHDLAVVHVVASNLPTVSLANSDAVQLAEEVRAVGYPLSNLLGESVKITRGTIAGMVNTSGHKLFQVDASINPGNSGGPLVNEMGQVVGVASAKLAREDIDGVGFAVPASDVLALLRSKGISRTADGPGQKLDGPTLAKRVTPAVAMIKVTIGPGGFGTANRLVLDFNGHVTTSGPSRTVGRIRMPGAPNTESDRGKLLLSDRGELLDASGNGVQLPFLLGRLSALAIEPFASDDKRSWQSQRATVLTQIIGEQSNNSFSMRFRHRGRSPFAQGETKVVVTPAIETASYELTSMNGDVATITKRYTFQTLDPAGSPPTAKVTGEGTMTFNRASGCAEKMDYKATLVRSVNNVSVTVPMTLEWHRLSQAELDQSRAQARANQQAATANQQPPSNAAGQTVTVVVQGVPPGASDVITERLKKLPGVTSFRSRSVNSLTTITVGPVSDLKDVVAAIDFGTVTNVDEATRTITVRADAAKLRKVAESKNMGDETEFVGGSTGGTPKRTSDGNSLLYGLECGFGEWGREQCLKDVAPIFAPGQELKKPGGAVAREGYAVGAVNIHAGSYVNAIQLIFMRVKDDGRLNPKDSYTSPWIGVRGKGQPRTLTGNGDPIIGISLRQGLVCDAFALVVNRAGGSGSSPSPNKGASATSRSRQPAPPNAAEMLTNSVGLRLARIPAGEFDMGGDEPAEKLEKAFEDADEPGIAIFGDVSMPSTFDPPGFPEFIKSKDYAAERPVHRVKITKPFYLGAYEVTKGQFRKFVDATGYKTDAEKDGKGGWLWVQEAETCLQKPEYNWRSWEPQQGDDEPVVNVSWNDATAFCKWLSGKESKTYRLPTEAEWEYACRAGSKTRFYGGDNEVALLKLGNVRGFRLELVSETKQKGFTHTRMAPKPKDGYTFTSPVGHYRPNAFGLYDMSGNVSEWCADWFDAGYYAQSPGQDPTGPASGSNRVLRGGGWDSAPIRCRSAFRSGASPTDRFASIGFRIARAD